MRLLEPCGTLGSTRPRSRGMGRRRPCCSGLWRLYDGRPRGTPMNQPVVLATRQLETERPLHITLLGSPQLTLLGAPISLPRRQLRALLYRLAVALQPVPREQLCFLFWPDIP